MNRPTALEQRNSELMEEFGLTGSPPFREIISIRAFGDIAIVEAHYYEIDEETGLGKTAASYHPYVNGRRCNEITERGWDKALLIALGVKYKTYPDFANLVALMLGMEKLQ